MAWNEGYHASKRTKFANTNETLSKIEGEIGVREAQSSFAQFCCANPAFSAKLLMGIDIYPFQDVMLRAMMTKDYFLGVAGRGLGKSKSYQDSSFVITKSNGLIPVTSLFPNLEFREEEYVKEFPEIELWNGKSYQKTSKILVQAKKNCSSVKTRMGYELKGSTNHKIKVLDSESFEIVWKRYHELVPGRDFICISRSETPEAPANEEEKENAYASGFFVENNGLKEIPTSILENKSLLKHFLSGLFDANNGLKSSAISVGYCTTQKTLAQQVHLSLLNFGIVSSFIKRVTKPKYSRGYVVRMHGPEALNFYEKIGFRLSQKQAGEYWFRGKKFNNNLGAASLLCGNEKSISSEILDSGFYFDEIESITHSVNDCIDFCDIPDGQCYWSNGFISHNSTLASIFIPLYAIFNPGTTIGVTSATFRQCIGEGSFLPSNRGLVKIENLRIGDKVLSRTGEYNEISDHWKNSPSTGLKITDEFGDCFSCKIGHRVYSFNRENGSNEYVNVEFLKVGDTLIKQEQKPFNSNSIAAPKISTSLIESIEPIESLVTYDISVKNDPSYNSHGFIHHNSRSIFEKIEAITKKESGRFLKQCMRGNAKHNSDAWEMNIGDSKIVAIPLGCFPACQRVRTTSGRISIENFAPKEVGGWVNAHFGVVTEKGPTRCSHILNAGEQECIEIETERGYKLSVAKTHPLLSKQLEWVEAGNLKVGDPIAIDSKPYSPENPEFKFDFDIGYKYGVFQAFWPKVDERIYSCSEEFGKGFLLGLVKKLEKMVNHPRQKTKMSFCNEEVACEIQQFLLSCGVKSRRDKNSLGFLRSEHFTLHCYIGKRLDFTFSLENVSYLKTLKKDSSSFHDKIKSIKELGLLPTYDMRVPAENSYTLNGFISHNSGDKIRGYRFNLLVIDELLLLSEKVINEVLLPFMAIQVDPVGRQRVRDAEAELVKKGLMSPDDVTVFPNNKLVGLTSASYKFEYLYSLFEDYKSLIYDENAKNVSHGIMQFSCEMAPTGLYDESNVTNAKKTYSRAQFDREYMAQFTGDSSGFYSAKKLYEVSLAKGDNPTVKVKGDPGKNYILAIDPNYDASESSDHFAMCVLEINEAEETVTMVHGYAVAACTMSERMDYIKYLFSNFNIAYMIVDKAGGEKFVKDVNDLSILPFSLDFFDAEFEFFSEEELQQAKKTFDNGSRIKRIVHSQYFSASWIRTANENLSGAIENRKIFFGAPVDPEGMNFEGVNIANLKFSDGATYGSKPSDLETKKIDFADNQSYVVNLTKSECCLIEVTTTASGTQRFDLPSNMQRQTGPTKTRKDSYTVLVLANWGATCYFSMMKAPAKKKSTFKPSFIA